MREGSARASAPLVGVSPSRGNRKKNHSTRSCKSRVESSASFRTWALHYSCEQNPMMSNWPVSISSFASHQTLFVVALFTTSSSTAVVTSERAKNTASPMRDRKSKAMAQKGVCAVCTLPKPLPDRCVPHSLWAIESSFFFSKNSVVVFLPAAPACLLSAQNISSCHHRIVLHHTRTSTLTDALTTPTASEFHQGDVSRMYIGRG